LTAIASAAAVDEGGPILEPRLRLAGQYKVEKMPNFEEELFRRGEVCPPKSLDRHSFSGGG